MIISDFTAGHIEAAARIAWQNYEQERSFVPALPPVAAMPDLRPYAKNGLGVVAHEGDTIVGFMGSVSPFRNAFGSTGVTGVFSPMGVNAAIGADRARVYAHMYQAAAEKWVRAGAGSHAVSLYAHDREVQAQFYRYGFGLRCVDAIRSMDAIAAPIVEGYSFAELSPEAAVRVLPLENMLNASYLASPFFMYRERQEEADFLEFCAQVLPVYLVAEQADRMVAFIRAEMDGETFIKDTPGYLHIKGAYCLPKHRGKGLNRVLLSMLVQKLMKQGYTRLGVDFESINPTGYGFWLKDFAAYTNSVVRRIDEKAVPGA